MLGYDAVIPRAKIVLVVLSFPKHLGTTSLYSASASSRKLPPPPHPSDGGASLKKRELCCVQLLETN